MSCEICGRNSCTKSFHSVEAQQDFDGLADSIKDRAKEIIAYRIDRLQGHYHGDNYYIKLDDIMRTINDYD